MNEWKFLNQSQPQTLVNATILCYIDAVFGILQGVPGSSGNAVLIIVVGLGLGGFGIANDKRGGDIIAVIGALLQLVVLVLFFRGVVFTFPLILTLGFDVVLVVLLLHPVSRDYQRIWFR